MIITKYSSVCKYVILFRDNNNCILITLYIVYNVPIIYDTLPYTLHT